MKINLLKFGLRFLIAFCVLTGAFEALRGSAFERLVVEGGVVGPTGHLVEAFSPGAFVDLPRRVIVSGVARLHVTRGCEGVEMLFLLTAAILAFPATGKQRAVGLLLGSGLAYVLTVGRLAALVYTLKYWPDGWEAMHGLLMPLIPVIVIALFFMYWSNFTSANRPTVPG